MQRRQETKPSDAVTRRPLCCKYSGKIAPTPWSVRFVAEGTPRAARQGAQIRVTRGKARKQLIAALL